MTTTTETMLEAQRALMRLHDRLEIDRKHQERMEALRFTEDEVLNFADVCAKYRDAHKGPQPRAMVSGIRKMVEEADRIIHTERTERHKSENAANVAYILGEIK